MNMSRVKLILTYFQFCNLAFIWSGFLLYDEQKWVNGPMKLGRIVYLCCQIKISLCSGGPSQSQSFQASDWSVGKMLHWHWIRKRDFGQNQVTQKQKMPSFVFLKTVIRFGTIWPKNTLSENIVFCCLEVCTI